MRKYAGVEPQLVPLSHGKVATIDEDDAPRVREHLWLAKRAQNSDRWYAYAKIDGHEVKLHRFILTAAPDELVDHADRDGLNCRRDNLRLATPTQNAQNRKRDRRGSSGFKGVNRHASTRPDGRSYIYWQAVIWVDGKFMRLGLFKSAEEAARVYDQAAREHFGEFARLNFPEEGEQAA